MSKARALSKGLFDNDLIVKHLPSKFKTALINGLLFGGVSGTDTVVSGTPPLTLEDAVQAALVYLRQFGVVEQNGTPTPSSPVDIKCNNGTLRMVDDELPNGYKRLSGIQLQDARIVVPFYITGEDTLRFRARGTSGNWIGSFNDASANDNLSFYGSTNSGAMYARYNGQTGGSSIYTNTWYNIVISPTGVTGVRNPSSFTPATFTCSEPLNIGATSIEGTPGPNVSFEGNIVVDGRLTLIPCERESDNALGYYDGTAFYTSEIGTMTSLGYDTSHLVLGVVGTPEVITIGDATTVYKMEFALNYFADPEDDGYFDLTFKPADDLTLECGEATGGTIIVPKGESITFGIPTNEDGSVYAIQIYRDGQLIGEDPEFNDPIYVTEYAIEHVDPGTDPTKAVTITQMISAVGQTASAEDLLAVGDYKDEQEIITGSVKRKVGVKVLDGTETGWGTNGVNGFTLPLGDAQSGTDKTIVCSHFPYDSLSSGQCCRITNDGSLLIIYPSLGRDATLNDWTAWLAAQYAAGTPIIVIYPLAEETTETVDPQPLSTTAGDNTITVTAEVNNIPLEVKYKKA